MRRLAAWLDGQAWLLLTLTTLLWAGNSVAGRAIAGQMSPMVVVSLRWLVVCAVLGGLLRRQLPAAVAALLPRWRYVALMGALGFTGFNTLFYVAAYHTSAVNMSLLQAAIPVFVLAGAALLGGRIGALQICGLLATMAGVAVVSTGGEPGNILSVAFGGGDLLLLLACLVYAGYTLGLRARPAVPPLAFFAAMALAAFLSSLPLLLAEAMAGQAYWPTLKGWLILIYIAFGPSMLAQIFYMRGVEIIGAGRAGLYANLVPVFGAVLAVALLGEAFRPFHAVALALGLSGFWLSEQAPRPAAG